MTRRTNQLMAQIELVANEGNYERKSPWLPKHLTRRSPSSLDKLGVK